MHIVRYLHIILKRIGEHAMKNKRQEKILKMLQQDHTVKSLELKELFQVSMETIRRDLEALEAKGYVSRVYGGAALKSLYGEEKDTARSAGRNYREKQAIGRLAAELVEDGDAIILDVGTTALEVARNLKGVRSLKVFTNSVQAAEELMSERDTRVFLIGGEIRNGSSGLSTSGGDAEAMMRNFYVDKAFIAIGGLSFDSGICDYHMEEANLRRLFIRQAKKVVGLADHAKFGVTALNRICGLNDLDFLITDEMADTQMVNELRAMNIDVRIAKEE